MSRRILVPLASLSLSVAVVACSSDDSNGGGTTDVDAATPHDGGPVDSGGHVDSSVADGGADTNVADTSVADTNVADTNVADTNVADTNVADTNVADTSSDGATDDGATDGAPIDAAMGDAGLLPGYAIVYSASQGIGVDQRPAVSCSFDGAGHMTGYYFATSEQLFLGAATNTAAGTDGSAAWGAWRGGPTTGVFYANTTGSFTFPAATDGFHYAAGVVHTTLPTGTVVYALLGGSTPSQTGATGPGTLDSATVTVDFGAQTAHVQIGVTMPVNGAYAMDGTVALSSGAIALGDGNNTAYGKFVGAAGDRIILAYQLNAAVGDAAAAGKIVRGAVALKAP